MALVTAQRSVSMGDLRTQVQVLVDGLVESGSENGVQVAVYRRGDLVVDAVAGVADPETGRPVTSDTLFYSASTGKGVAATVAHVLVKRAVFGYDTPVAEVWPEFAAHGKDSATVRHVLTHSVGVPAVPRDITPEQLCDWDGMCRMIADAEPWRAPGERVGYHAVTFGYILGEIVRRATGRRISQVLAEESPGHWGPATSCTSAYPRRSWIGWPGWRTTRSAGRRSHLCHPTSRCSRPPRPRSSPTPTTGIGPTSSPPTCSSRAR